MHKFRLSAGKLIATLSIFSIALLGLNGCRAPEAADGSNTDYCSSNSDDSSTNPTAEIVAVMAPTSNFVNFDSIVQVSRSAVSHELGADLDDSKISTAIGSELSVVIADGAPKLAGMRVVNPKGSDVSDIEKQIATTTGLYEDVASCAAGDLKREHDQIATVEESDILGALAVAVDQLNSSKSVKKIFVLGNGYQTAGKIKMQDPGQFPNSAKQADLLVDGLADIGALPNLKGVTVVWYGMGQTYGEEMNLDQNSRDSLSYFWQQVITRSHGILSEDNIYKQVGSGAPHQNAIKVTNAVIQSCNLLVTLYESDGVEFKPNSASFVDTTKAKAKASTVVKEFQSANCDHITVHGFAASGVSKDVYEAKKSEIDKQNDSLTLLRAKAFAKLLKSAGFNGEISSEGAGTCDGDQWTSTGKLDESLQQLCRRVEVTN